VIKALTRFPYTLFCALKANYAIIKMLITSSMKAIMSSNTEELEERLSDLKKLACRLTADTRWLSTPLDGDSTPANDTLVASARDAKVPILIPLTIGTLLASVLGEIDSVECAMKSIARAESPGEEP
jgi:hypothetical protein